MGCEAMPGTLKTLEAASISPLAGLPAPHQMLIDPARLEREYFERRPDVGVPEQMVKFGTSGHRGSPFRSSFTESHIVAITQAICDYRTAHGTDGALYMGKDTHAISAAAQRTALEVLAANRVETIIQREDGVTPTPVISRAILVYNRGRRDHFADGIVITPSHNPPQDGGFKYNPANGGSADTAATRWIEDRANELLRGEDAGASFLRFDGTVWTTDKDSPIMDLLAAEITACTGRDPGEHYRQMTAEFGTPYYARIDAPATPEQKARLEKLSPDSVKASSLGGERIIAKLTRAPWNDALIGGLKVVTASGWFAARPSDTENIYKIYAESFQGEDHLNSIVSEAQEIVDHALESPEPRA